MAQSGNLDKRKHILLIQLYKIKNMLPV